MLKITRQLLIFTVNVHTSGHFATSRELVDQKPNLIGRKVRIEY